MTCHCGATDCPSCHPSTWDYPDWVCADCGEKHGRGMPVGHCAAWHEDQCGICGEWTSVTEPRDYRHLKETWRAARDAAKL
jgi:hypothetical protein